MYKRKATTGDYCIRSQKNQIRYWFSFCFNVEGKFSFIMNHLFGGLDTGEKKGIVRWESQSCFVIRSCLEMMSKCLSGLTV
jgi:hypothetical protein